MGSGYAIDTHICTQWQGICVPVLNRKIFGIGKSGPKFRTEGYKIGNPKSRRVLNWLKNIH